MKTGKLRYNPTICVITASIYHAHRFTLIPHEADMVADKTSTGPTDLWKTSGLSAFGIQAHAACGPRYLVETRLLLWHHQAGHPPGHSPGHWITGGGRDMHIFIHIYRLRGCQIGTHANWRWDITLPMALCRYWRPVWVVTANYSA